MSWLHDAVTAPFMQRAMVEVLLLAVLCGAVGTLVLVRRLAFVTDALSHTIFPGVAIAFFAGGSLFLGALAAAALSCLLLAVLARSRRLDPDSVLALLVTAFFSLGVVVVSRRPSYRSDLTELLFGRLLLLDADALVETAAVAAVVVTVLAALSKELLLRAFDEDAAQAMGYRVVALDLVANAAVAMVVVAGARAVGTALVIALLVVPPATARLVAGSVVGIAVVSAALVVVCGAGALLASYGLSSEHDVAVAPGPLLTVVLTAVFLTVAGARALAGRIRARPA